MLIKLLVDLFFISPTKGFSIQSEKTGLTHYDGGGRPLYKALCGICKISFHIFLLVKVESIFNFFGLDKDTQIILKGIVVIYSLIQVYIGYNALRNIEAPDRLVSSIISRSATNGNLKSEIRTGNIDEFKGYVDSKMSVMSNSRKEEYVNYLNGGKNYK